MRQFAVVSWPAEMKVSDVRANLDLAQSLAGLRILRLQQQREQVLRHAVGLLRDAPPAPGDDRIDRTLEDAHGRAGLQAAEPRHRSWQAEDIEGIDPPDGVEIALHALSDLLGVAAEAVGEDRPLEDVQARPA